MVQCKKLICGVIAVNVGVMLSTGVTDYANGIKLADCEVTNETLYLLYRG